MIDFEVGKAAQRRGNHAIVLGSFSRPLCDRDVKELGSMKVGRLCFAGLINR
jgi:hypothetical protein